MSLWFREHIHISSQFPQLHRLLLLAGFSQVYFAVVCNSQSVRYMQGTSFSSSGVLTFAESPINFCLAACLPHGALSPGVARLQVFPIHFLLSLPFTADRATQCHSCPCESPTRSKSARIWGQSEVANLQFSPVKLGEIRVYWGQWAPTPTVLPQLFAFYLLGLSHFLPIQSLKWLFLSSFKFFFLGGGRIHWHSIHRLMFVFFINFGRVWTSCCILQHTEVVR